MHIETVLSVAFVAISIYQVYRIFLDYWRLRHIPGPLLAAFSNIPRASWVLTGQAQDIHAQLHVKYGPVVRFGPNMVSVDDPLAIPTIYPTKPGFVKGDFYETLKPYSGIRGAIPAVFPTQDEELHKKLKKPVAPLFSITSAATLEPFVDDVLSVFFKQLDDRFVKTCLEFDLGFWLKAFAFDTMGTLTFSKRYGFLETGEDVDGMEASIWNFMVKAAPMTQIPWLDKIMYKNVIAAWFSPPTSSPILKFVAERIAEREQDPIKHSKDDKDVAVRRDMLSHFMSIPHEQPSVPKWAPTSWTFSNVLAGSDSAATVMAAVWYNLLTHSDSLERLEEEVLSIHDITKPFPAWREIKDLCYLDACIWEGIRLHPPFALPFERIVPPGGINVCGLDLPQGTEVGMGPYVVNRHKTFGAHPNEWRPERWLSEDPEHTKKLQNSVMTFGSGRRICMGQNIAFVEMKKSIAALILNYRITIGESTNYRIENRWFLRNEGLHARISKRLI